MITILNKLDFFLLDAIHNHLTNDVLDWIMPRVSFLGNSGLIWIIAAVLMILLRKYRKNGIVLLIGLLCGLIIGNLILKNVIARDRPCWINDTVQLLIAVPRDYSFPSGHTLSAFIAATILMRTNSCVGVVAFILAICIAFSRLYLYVHFPSDILAGALLGIIIGTGVSVICEKRLGIGKLERSK